MLHTESHDPAVPAAYSAFMRQGWGDRELDLPPHPITPYAAARRQRLAEAFPGERLVLPAGGFKVRSYDTDYRFRPDTAHTYFCGNQTSDAVLVVDGGESILYARPRSEREHRRVLPRPAVRRAVGGPTPVAEGDLRLPRPRGAPHRPARVPTCRSGGKTRVHRGVSESVDRLVAADESRDSDFARVASEMRLLKDEWEVAELQTACDITTLGFTDSVAEWDRVLEFGERWVEGTFFRRARAMGNDIGYDSIVGGGSHATTLHWIDNTGPINRGELVLLDMGVEGHNLYTADVTRTLPIDGTFTSLQRELYDLVYAAQEAGIKAVRPGAAFTDPHNAAMVVLAHGLESMSLLPVSAEEALDPESKVYARWTLHGVSHMLGMDVHDCGQASPEAYNKGTLAEDMVLTVEPGLYFQSDDLLVPEEMRGIGIRIEDDILVTADGSRNLSAALPRTSSDVEEWMASSPGADRAGVQRSRGPAPVGSTPGAARVARATG